MAKGATLNVEGKEVPVSNLEKVYYPKAGFTKGEMLAYYIKIAPVLLPHGKVLVDWSQNSETKTTVCVYSLRAKERPFVSMPLEWHEVERYLEEEGCVTRIF